MSYMMSSWHHMTSLATLAGPQMSSCTRSYDIMMSCCTDGLFHCNLIYKPILKGCVCGRKMFGRVDVRMFRPWNFHTKLSLGTRERFKVKYKYRHTHTHTWTPFFGGFDIHPTTLISAFRVMTTIRVIEIWKISLNLFTNLLLRDVVSTLTGNCIHNGLVFLLREPFMVTDVGKAHWNQ